MIVGAIHDIVSTIQPKNYEKDCDEKYIIKYITFIFYGFTNTSCR